MNPIDRLGSVLLHFLWQGAAIAALFAVARAGLRRAAPNTRYAAACAALAAMLAAPLITWFALAPQPLLLTPAEAARWTAPLPYSPTAPITMAVFAPAPARYLPWVVAAWLTGAALLSLRLLRAYLFVTHLRSRHARPAPAEWQLTLDRLRSRFLLARPVRLLVSAAAEVPSVVGCLRPVVLVPAAALAGLPPAHLEAILFHELAHIRRHDYLVNLLQSVAETLLFYHPAVWWISAHIRAEREHACDDLAVAATGDVLTYARALAALESARPSRFTPALAATGRPLAARIARLLGRPRAAAGPAPAAVAAVIALAAAALYAQSAAVPRFEVAAIKPSNVQNMMYVRALPGGRLNALAPLKLLLQNAYSLQAYQIVGGPSWIDSDRFEIEAKAEGNPSREKLLQMLQPLLADRFHLQAHRESRDLPVYALTVAKGGPKLPAHQAGSCVSLTPDSGPPRPAPGFSPPCGHLGILGVPNGARLLGGDIALPELIRTLAMILGRPVLDRTGLTAAYDVKLEFTPDSLAAGLGRQVKNSAEPQPPSDDAPPSIVTALQQQLGLKLESTKGPVDILVIDHVERPTAN